MSTNNLNNTPDSNEYDKMALETYRQSFYNVEFSNLCYRLTSDPEYLPKKLTEDEELEENKIRKAKCENNKRIMTSNYSTLTPEEVKYKVNMLVNDAKYLLSRRTEFLEWDHDGANADLDSLIKDYEKFLNTKELNSYIGDDLVTILSIILDKYKQIKYIVNVIENL